MESQDIESPCVGVCKIDQNNLCEGCFRTLAEIASWGKYSRVQRAAVLLAVKERRTED